jgi:hypothetical protein
MYVFGKKVSLEGREEFELAIGKGEFPKEPFGVFTK